MQALVDHPLLVFCMFAAALGLAALLSWRVDVNEFSMHNFYRNRLVRAYLGASRERNPVPFTGFDPKDDLPLADLQGPGDDASGRLQLPIHILNTTLNVTTGEELAWQERKASSFFFTPFHYGFDPGRLASGLSETGYRPTRREDERLSLGTALAISGAALNPNMGYHSASALAFLMTVFNSRLGWWLRNPKLEKWSHRGPLLGLLPLFDELRGKTGAQSAYVNLADGGFFENLGIYELVRRRCRFILACDAEADADYQFNGLGNAIRRCRSDFGIDIQIQVDPIRKREGQAFSDWHCAVGTIRYRDVDEGASDGILVYLKASLTGDEPEDLLNYAARRKGFPHESTADQWFGEAQFESYRMLGFHQASEMLGAAGIAELAEEHLEDRGRLYRRNVEHVFGALKRTWYPPSAAQAGSFTRHTEKLVRIFEQLRDNPDFAFLDRGLYLEVDQWRGRPPAALAEAIESLDETPPPKAGALAPRRGEETSDRQLRAGFYLCSSMIQLMENVYLDLDLEHEWSHPDNRGWMNLFRHWATDATFRKTWAVSAATYGARFQNFCWRRLNLDLGTVQVERMTALDPARLSSLESSILDEMRRSGQIEDLEQLYLLQMSVLKPEAVVRRRDMNQFESVELASEDQVMQITFGLAATSGPPADEPLGSRPSGQLDKRWLRFFRVRNHLRQLGLARQALHRLVVDHGVREIELSASAHADPERRAAIKNLFRSVINEYYRWKDGLLIEIYNWLERHPESSDEKIRAEIRQVQERWRVRPETIARLSSTEPTPGHDTARSRVAAATARDAGWEPPADDPAVK